MKLTKDRALELHRQMWSDMQMILGNNPSRKSREEFKEQWCKSHFPNQRIWAHCFLCEYDESFYGECDHCPINWGTSVHAGCTGNEVKHYSSPISEILALPEREDA